MDENSTQVKSDNQLLKILLENKGASVKTLNFLKMVARSYHSDSSLPTELNTTCMN